MKKIYLVAVLLSLSCFMAETCAAANKSVKSNSCINPILPYNLCADPTAIEYNGRLYVYGSNDQLELETTGDSTKNTYGKITQLVCMSSADLANWTFHPAINVKKLSPWIATSWAPSVVSREESDGKTHFYLYYTNSASGIGVLTSTSPTGPWKDPLGKALIYWGTSGRGEQSNIIDPGVCIDDNGTGWLTFGGGDPNKKGSTLLPGNARIVKLGKNMISLDGKMIEIPAPFHFEANELNYIDGKYIFSYSGGWSCNTTDWSNYDGKGSYSCPGNCSIMAMSTDDPVNGTWTYMGEILKNPGTFGYPWGNNHSHLQKFGNTYYMLYHTQYLEKQLGLSGGYRGIAIDKATVSSTSITASMDDDGPTFLSDKCPLANELTEAETMCNCAGIKVVANDEGGCHVTGIDTGDWTMIRGMKFPEDAQSLTVRIKGKGTLKLYSGRPAGRPLATAEFNNEKMAESTFDLSAVIPADKTYSYLCFLFEDVDEATPVEFDSYRFNAKSASELTAIKTIQTTNDAYVLSSDTTYNLSGQQVCANARGIVIKSGHKYISK